MTPLERAVDAAWTELERQRDAGKPGPYVDRDELSVIDGEVDMPALVRAVLTAIREPSEGMLKAGEAAVDEYSPGTPVDLAWKDMLDAAIAEGE